VGINIDGEFETVGSTPVLLTTDVLGNMPPSGA
jgi:hypothetical protein